MTATQTMQEEVQERLQQEVQEFKMPVPQPGQSVMWYANGDRTGKREVCWVLRVGSRNVELRPASGLTRPGVFHIDDPRIRQSEDIRKDGGWDFTDKDKLDDARDKKLEALMKRVEKLEARNKDKSPL